ncbi:MAG TPA: hypothetical protein VL498_07055 [Terracidiphilus sp.]|jgi:hypothetical protein|nr:hypothetical protein [Terracidiphilus sp.]
MIKEANQLVLLPQSEESPTTDLKSWALVELFGHQRIVGFLSQQAFGSGVLFRVDVPDLTSSGKVIREGFTRYFGLAAIYSITPISEQMVKELLPGIDGTPGEARALSSRSYSRDDAGY